MNKKNEPIEQKPDLTDTLNEHPAVEWVAKNGVNLLIALFVLVIAGVFLFRNSQQSFVSDTQQYLAAENLTAKLKESPLPNIPALEEIQGIIRQHPELNAKYDGILAQILMNEGEFQKAQPLAKDAIDRSLDNQLPLYAYFAKTSLLLNQEKYELALKHAIALQTKMEQKSALPREKRDFGDALFAYNLLRIGMLQKELALTADEKNTWERWRELSKSENAYAEGFRTISRQFQSGSLTLDDYIAEREKVLSGSKTNG